MWTKHKAQITDVAYTKNGLFVISGSTDNNIIMWTSQSKEVRPLPPPPPPLLETPPGWGRQ